MKEKKINLLTVFLIICIIIIIIMAIYIYKLYNEKTKSNEKPANSQEQVTSLNETVTNSQEEINSISDETNSNTLKNPTNSENSTSNSSKSTNNTTSKDKSYDSYIGTWYNSETKNEFEVKKITKNKITFTWSLYRLAGIDNTTIDFSNGKAIFYYKGYDDKNFDDINTEDEKYIRKATIKLDKNGVTVDVKDVDSIDDNYPTLDFDGSVYLTKGLYTHPKKR